MRYTVKHSNPQPRLPLPKSLWILSGISLFADLAGEMTYPLLPMFVIGVLGASPVALGLIEGVAEAIVSIVRGLAGYHSDSSGHRVRWVRRGYGFACLGKAIIAIAGGWGMVFSGRLLDRIGKGIRSAPRDALIAESVPESDRGRAFGFHRGIDSYGGVAGSLIAAGIIAWSIGSRPAVPEDGFQFRIIFACAAVAALTAWALTFLIPRTHPDKVLARREAHATARHKSFGRAFWIAIVALVLFSLGNSSDTFLLLRALELGSTPVESILMYATLSATYAIASYPMGLLSDRFGRWHVLATGWVLYAISYASFALVSAETRVGLWGIFAIYGVSVACIEGTARALIVDCAPKERLATALGIFGFLQGISLLIASLFAGWLWSTGNAQVVFWIGALFAAIALGILPWLPRLELRSS